MRYRDLKNNRESDAEWADPHLQKKLQYAKSHYPYYGSATSALTKLLVRAVQHSEEKDEAHDQQLSDLTDEIQKLKQSFASLGKQKTKGVNEAVPSDPAVYQQQLLDRLGAKYGLPAGSTIDQVRDAQLAILDKSDPAAAAQARKNWANIAAGQSAASQAPVKLAPQQPSADFTAGLGAARAGKGATSIMLAQPSIANNQAHLDKIAAAYGLPKGLSAAEIEAQYRQAAQARGQAQYAQQKAAAAPAVAEDEGVAASPRLQRAHQRERERRGLPHPDEYLRMIAQKKKEIEALRREIEQDRQRAGNTDVSEATGDRQFDDMMRKIKRGTKKQATADRRERERQSREQARAAFGPSPADKLSIRPDKGISETSDYFRRREREEAIISGQKPARKKQPAQTSDYALRRAQEKKAEKGVAEGSTKQAKARKESKQDSESVTITFSPDDIEVVERAAGRMPDALVFQRIIDDYEKQAGIDRQDQAVLDLKLSSSDRDAIETVINKFGYRLDETGIFKHIMAELNAKQGVSEAGYNPLDDERREQQAMDQERAEFKRDELEAELGGEEQRAQTIMSGTWYVIIDGQVWRRQGQPVTFAGRDAARRAGQTIKQRNPGKIVTITTQLPAVREANDPGSVVNDQGLTQGQWIQQHQSQGARIIQSKMVNGPAFARYPDGRQETWRADQTPMTEARDKKHHWIYESHVDEEYNPAKERERWEAMGAQFIRQREEAEERDRQRQAQKPSAAQSGRSEFVAPHGDAANELRMFQAGSKPAAVINTPDVGIWNDIIRSGRYVVQRLLGQDGKTAGYVVGQPGEDERVEKIHALVQNASNRAHQGDFRAYENSNYHRWLGRLLGYPTDKIEAFIQNYFRDTPDRARARYDEDYVQAFREALAEGVTSEDVLSSMKRRLGDYLQDVATAIRKDPDLIDKIPKTTDQIGPAVRTMRTDDGHEIRIHGNEDDGFRISVRGRNMESRFSSLEEAEIATEMYMARRRENQAITDDYVQEKNEPNLRKTARTQRMMSQLRAKYPQAESDLEALLYDFRAGQRMDRQDINRLDSELDSDEAQIDRIRQDLDDLMRRRGMTEIEIVEAKKDACYNKVKSRYKVWPSAYASGALVQCRKKGAKNWGKKSQVNEGWRQTLAAMAAAGIMALSGGSAAQAAATDTNPNKITATIQIDGQTQIFDLSSKGRDVKEASRWLEQFLDSRGVEGWTASVERGVRGSGNYQRMNIDSQGGPIR